MVVGKESIDYADRTTLRAIATVVGTIEFLIGIEYEVKGQ